jgi:hypothetical protein
MNRHEQIDAFYNDLSALVKRYNAEFDIDMYTIVGVLEDKKVGLLLGEESVEFSADEDILDTDDEE